MYLILDVFIRLLNLRKPRNLPVEVVSLELEFIPNSIHVA